MNRRDFETVIRALNGARNAADTPDAKTQHTVVVLRFADELGAADGCSGFNRGIFLARCGVKP